MTEHASSPTPDRVTENLSLTATTFTDNHNNAAVVQGGSAKVTLADGSSCIANGEAAQAIFALRDHESFVDSALNWLRHGLSSDTQVSVYDAPTGTIPNLCAGRPISR
jgi:hypothetical protein